MSLYSDDDREDNITTNVKRLQIIKNDRIYSIIQMLKDSVNESPTLKCKDSLVFQATSIPDISIKEYIIRLYSYCNCSDSCYVCMLIYIDRLMTKLQNFDINLYNIHIIILLSLLVAIKNFDDTYFSNKMYASVGGINVGELNKLELYFLKLIEYDLHIEANAFIDWLCIIDEYR